jgi:hypothetical protein
MRIRLPANLLLALALAATAHAAPPIELELATERGLQITAPQEWLQLLTSLGIENVRIRAANPGDEPKLENRGSDERPRYHVVGILTAREELRLPGGTFHASDRQELRDYLVRLAADGPDAITAPRGRFGLTEKQFAAVHADLAQPVDFATKGQPLRAVIDQLQAKFSLRISPDAAAEPILRDAVPIRDELRGITAGTGLAIMLRSHGLVLRPEKALGQPAVLRIASIDPAADAWPIGWEPEQTLGQIAPVLLEFLNVEIDGYTLAEAVDAIALRIKIPIYWDHATLAAHQIDPTAVKVALPRTRTYYKRILDRILAQARLGVQLRLDEAGTPFLWITK